MRKARVQKDVYTVSVLPVLQKFQGCEVGVLKDLANAAIKAIDTPANAETIETLGQPPHPELSPEEQKELKIAASIRPFSCYIKLFDFLRACGGANDGLDNTAQLGFRGALHCEVSLSSLLHPEKGASGEFQDPTQLTPEVSFSILFMWESVYRVSLHIRNSAM